MAQGRGRPRNFDSDEALDAALSIFWKNGFDAASLSDLTESTGLTKPSLYAAFGDKEALYLRVLERYKENWLARHIAVLESEPQAKDAVERFMHSLAEMLTSQELPGGCFVVNGVSDVGAARTTARIEDALRSTLQQCEKAIEHRLMRAQRDRQLPESANAAALAGYFYTVIAGLAVKAKAGARKEDLGASIGLALAVWPSS
jgi:AcrR family transcriptional regulator